ncbi:MAG: DUF2059 domain-containing protein [Betaproteobacteria bacterium]|nr:DUF2059 domain-containing protein [Betaproteobacteria bacterium]
MRKLIQGACFVLAAAFTHAASAGEPIDAAKEAALNRLFDAMDFEKTLQQTMGAMKAALPQQMAAGARGAIEQSGMSEEKKREALTKLDEEMPKLGATLMDQFLGKEFLDDVQKSTIQIYGRHFTTAEIDELAAFYRSPIGKKMMTKLPVITQESMQFTMQQVQKRIPLIQQEAMKRFGPAPVK